MVFVFLLLSACLCLRTLGTLDQPNSEYIFSVDPNLSKDQQQQVVFDIFETHNSFQHFVKRSAQNFHPHVSRIGTLNYFSFQISSKHKESIMEDSSHPLYFSSLFDHPDVSNIQFSPKMMHVPKASPNDPSLINQWHLCFIDWSPSSPPNGAQVAIVDDGLQYSNPDISPNYVSADSYDFYSDDSNPSPSPGNTHGTSCGGIVSAALDNDVCGSGVTPKAPIAGVRLLGPGGATISQTVSSLSYHYQNTAIYSNSWGPNDDGSYYLGDISLVESQFIDSTSNGRSGLGSIFTWAGGNGRGNGDNSNRDPYANSIYTISVAAANHQYTYSYYSEAGANVLVSAPSSGYDYGITTTTTTTHGTCTSQFGGTSSACPTVAGVISSMLYANPTLTWRDVMWILVQTSFKLGSSGWRANTAGFCVNENYGHGAINLFAARNAADSWVNVAPMVDFSSTSGLLSIPLTPFVVQNNSISISAGQVSASNMSVIEQIVIQVNFTHTHFTEVTVKLTSPSGNSYSILIDNSNVISFPQTFSSWKFSTVMHWGETDITGTWTLELEDRVTSNTGTWTGWSIHFYGASSLPVQYTPNGCVDFRTSLPSCSFMTASPANSLHLSLSIVFLILFVLSQV